METIAFGLALALVHFELGVWKNLYEVAWFGRAVHFVGGIFLASLVVTLGLPAGAFVALPLLWEFFEALVDSDKLGWHSRSLAGAAQDILWTFVGSFAYVYLWIM